MSFVPPKIAAVVSKYGAKELIDLFEPYFSSLSVFI